jgi:hypothetical protein
VFFCTCGVRLRLDANRSARSCVYVGVCVARSKSVYERKKRKAEVWAASRRALDRERWLRVVFQAMLVLRRRARNQYQAAALMRRLARKRIFRLFVDNVRDQVRDRKQHAKEIEAAVAEEKRRWEEEEQQRIEMEEEAEFQREQKRKQEARFQRTWAQQRSKADMVRARERAIQVREATMRVLWRDDTLRTQRRCVVSRASDPRADAARAPGDAQA